MMKYFVILFFSILMASNAAFAQDNYKKHKVEKSETVSSIAKKYKVTPYDIYRLNPDSQKGLKEGGILLIPNETKKEPVQPVKEQPTKVANTIHEVEAKETLYSLSKKYNVTVDEITKANGEAVKNGLQIGQKVIIPLKGSVVAAQVKVVEKEAKEEAPAYFYHTVAAGETKYSIAKRYGMTLQLLEALNPEVKEILPLNYRLKLDKTAVISKETEPVAPVEAPSQYMIYKVTPKETIYNLTKKTGLTEEEIIALNPHAKEGLREGMELRLPKAKVPTVPGEAPATAEPTNTVSGSLSNLSKSLKKSNPRELALLLPFNMARVESDTVRTQLLRTDRFLNMTLDFYAGALMAIDSAKVLGLPLKVRIVDANEARSSSDIESFKRSIASADAVIGPFYQINVEKTAEALEGIPVISPLSKEPGKPYPNLFQSVPSPERVKMAMLDYLKSKDGNVVAIVDPKKASSRVLIKNNYPSARFADGAITAATVKLLLVKDKMNYVIMESESTGMIQNTTRILFEALNEYQIQLVVLEKTDELDHDEVPLARLTALKLLYPSVTKDNETPEAAIFSRVFKQKNGIFPNQYATRGFDVTFDVILRLFQEQEFKEVMAAVSSEQVENKFMYAAQNGGNYNTGVYIMYYDQDLSVKQAQ